MPDRPLFYAGQQALSADVLRIAQSGMIGDGMLGLLLAGTTTVAAGLACTPTSPASMVVNIAPGLIIQSSEVDATAYGSLGTNTASIQKLGTILASTPFTLTAPTTSGQSINYLIEASMQDTDSGSTVLNYVNAADPSQPFTGPNNDGVAQNTIRSATVGLQLLAGAAATTGTQTTPATTSGWSPLYVITVNYGQTTVTASSIVTASGAPFVGGGSVIGGRWLASYRNTTAGAFSFTPPPGTKRMRIKAIGGGGAGGGVQATEASTYACGAAGANGSFLELDVTGTIAATYSGTIGAAGTGAASGTSHPGGATSVTGIFSTPGGGAGSSVASAGAQTSAIDGAPGGAATITTGTVVNEDGGMGPACYSTVSSDFGIAGHPSATPFPGCGMGGYGSLIGPNTAAANGLTGQAGGIQIDFYS